MIHEQNNVNHSSVIVSAVDVFKTYNKGIENISIFSDLNLDICKGEFVAIMGASGSGKTTLLNLLGGLDRPTQGEIYIKGKNVALMSNGELADWRAKSVGYVAQFHNLIPVLDAYDNIALPLSLHRLKSSKIKKLVNTVLEMVGLSDRANFRPHELSGGQQQRVAIARALVTNPSLLLCDEPTGNLDSGTGETIMKLLHFLNKEHDRTIIMVTHNEKASQYASKILDLDQGVFIQRIKELT